VQTEPCGNIRRVNVEIPTLSVSDMKRLKATDCVGTFTLFQETYHRPTFSAMHVSGPKSDYDHRLLTQDRAFRGGIDDVGIGTLFGLYDYRYEVLAMLQHANHLEAEYGAGPHTISVPRLRPADGSDVSIAPPHEVDDANFKKLVAIIRIAVPYTGMILSTRESPAMRDQLLQVGMSQMSAGSRTDVGAYHRDDSAATNKHLGDLAGQFSLMDHRSASEVVKDLMAKGYVPSWCTACYRKGRTGEHFMKIAKAGNIHNFCHPNSLLTLQEYLQDYGDAEAQALGAALIAQESGAGLSGSAQRLLARKMAKVKAGEHDVYI
jgi:[FeFe] hydrogenase H-cluster radical SAM maturase HydG